MAADAEFSVEDDLGEIIQKIKHEDKDMADRQTWKIRGPIPEVMLKQRGVGVGVGFKKKRKEL